MFKAAPVILFTLAISLPWMGAEASDDSDPGLTDAILDASRVPTGPLRVRNVSPAVQLYGLPRMTGAYLADEDLEASFNVEISNNFQSKDAYGTFAFFDGETYVGSYRMRRGFAERWEWGLEIPYVRHTAGNFDALVDEFHELFGLPDGMRSLAPRNRLDYFVGSQGVVYADFDDATSSLGDIRGTLGLQLFADDTSALALRAMVKAPTGKVDDLSGSEALDVAVWGEYERAFDILSREWRITVGGGASYLGEGEFIPDDQESWVAIGHLGLHVPLSRRIAFIVQVDAHSTVLDTGNPLVADGGVLGTLGGRIGVTERFWVDLGVIEDLDNKSASDVVFQVLLGTKL